ncbi:MAG: hypothetical protein Q8K92_21915, partial [Leadbetterella sp.]|nr:hypothetical protein [Leadbetterella sp.]
MVEETPVAIVDPPGKLVLPKSEQEKSDEKQPASKKAASSTTTKQTSGAGNSGVVKDTPPPKPNVVETDIPASVEMYLKLASGQKINATVQKGKRVFEIPIGQKGLVKVYFKANSQQGWEDCWDNVDIKNLGNITLPDCAKM